MPWYLTELIYGQILPLVCIPGLVHAYKKTSLPHHLMKGLITGLSSPVLPEKCKTARCEESIDGGPGVLLPE